MSLVLTIAQVATAVNAVLLLGLIYVWGTNYRQYRAQHTLGLLVFAGFLFVENALAVYLYLFQPVFSTWLSSAAPLAQNGMMALDVLELAALLFLTKITWA
ncbi:MAG: hypothetical protein ABEH90_11425 [Halolamina sp.]